MKRLFVTTSIGGLGLCALLLVPLQGCTDLNETPISSITPSNFFHTDGEVLAGGRGEHFPLGVEEIARGDGPDGRLVQIRASLQRHEKERAEPEAADRRRHEESLHGSELLRTRHGGPP